MKQKVNCTATNTLKEKGVGTMYNYQKCQEVLKELVSHDVLIETGSINGGGKQQFQKLYLDNNGECLVLTEREHPHEKQVYYIPYADIKDIEINLDPMYFVNFVLSNGSEITLSNNDQHKCCLKCGMVLDSEDYIVRQWDINAYSNEGQLLQFRICGSCLKEIVGDRIEDDE